MWKWMEVGKAYGCENELAFVGCSQKERREKCGFGMLLLNKSTWEQSCLV